MAAYQKSPFEDLTIQDALTLIAVYAAQTGPQDCEKDVKRIGNIAERRPEFVEKKGNIFRRINKYMNSMQRIDPQKALEIACDVLNPKLKKIAFDIAAEVALPDKVLTAEKKTILNDIATKLLIDREFAKQTLNKFTQSSLPHD